MNINPISFGKKIPIANCKILDTQKKVPVEAIFFEYDCKDHKDSIEVGSISGKWAFKNVISAGMERKFKNHLRGKSQIPNAYYGLQTSDGKVLGLVSAENYTNRTEIEYITRDLSTDYKYVGQMMLAQLAKMALDENKYNLIINNPINDNYEFYRTCCGFRFISDTDSDMTMDRKEMTNFIMNTEDKTDCSIF